MRRKIDGCGARDLSVAERFRQRKTEAGQVLTHLAVDLLNIVIFAQFVTFRVYRDRPIRVSSHGNLVRLHHADVTVLIQDAERVALGFEDDADGLLAGERH